MYNINGYFHVKFYYLNSDGTIKTYVGYDNTNVQHRDDVCFHGCRSLKAFIAECRNNSIIVPKNVIANYWKNN